MLSPEWASEWIAHWSRDWDIVNALDLAGKFGIVVAVFFYFAEAGDRQKAKHYGAWASSTPPGGRRGMADADLLWRASTRTRCPWPRLLSRRRSV